MISKFCPVGHLIVIFKRRILPPQNYLRFLKGKSFLKQGLIHSLYAVSIGFDGDSFFLKWCWRDMSEWGDKKNSGWGEESTMDDIIEIN